MRIRLFYKIYFVVLFSVIMSVGISVLIVGFYGYRNFRSYLAESKLQEFSWLAERLGQYYDKHGNFDAIRDLRIKMVAEDPELGRGFDHHFPGEHGGMEPGKGRDGFRVLKKPDGIPHGPDRPDRVNMPGREGQGDDSKRGPLDGFLRKDGMPKDFGMRHELGFKLFGPPGASKQDNKVRNEFLEKIFYNDKTGLNLAVLVKFQEFISITDKDKNVITGVDRELKKHEYVYTAIVSKGKTVGYLGFRKPPDFEHPLAAEFISQQFYLMLVTTVIIIIVTGLASWVFTRKVIAPVPKLITATRKLASRDFDIDLKKETNDELGDLAVNFCKMADDLRMYEVKQNRWISDISHELRTPLSVLLGSIEAMQDGVRKMDADTLSILHEEVKRLTKLVNDLHEITMAESGGLSFDMRIMHIGEVLANVLSLYEVRCAEFGFKLETMTKHCDVLVNADVSRLRQVFINILENSLKHAKSPGSIYVSCAARDGRVLITFEDSGPGVPEAHLPMLFDRLFRSDSSRNRMTGGSGLGLAICKYIVTKHKGQITASRSAMGGLKIEIDIPTEKRDE